ncbi:M13-type metalloendopeptidase [Companilactobacillus ginsenosidimutans]|uniref:M13-type metalloendopeptidase n=1 Tax=Companilactobacillus ginsenosidimutans TaxID=1007676 RepID=UPI00065FC3B7|nr:M13 family metallopeptidase [Companilactobacillus ginsenosidimutans]
MKHRGSIFICGAALAILLGITSVQTAQADITSDQTNGTTENVVSTQADTSTTTTDTAKSNTSQQNDKQYPGGDWSVDPTTATAQENYYYYVNGKWQESTKIPADKQAVGVTDDMQNTVTTKMTNDLNAFASGQKQAGSTQLQQAVDFYQKAKDTYKQKQAGYADINKDIKSISSMKDYDDFNQNLVEFSKEGFALPFDIGVEPGLKDSTKHILYFNAPGTILPDRSYYDNDDDGTAMLSAYSESASKMLELVGYNESDINKTVEQALAFDRLIAKNTSDPSNAIDDPDAFYKPMDAIKFAKSFKSLKLGDYVQALFPTNTADLDIYDKKYFGSFNNLVNKNNFEMIKSWMVVRLLTDNAQLLGKDATAATAPYVEKYKGISQLPNDQKRAYTLTGNNFEQILSEYYGKTYFGEAAKKDATRLIDNILSVYHDRISNNTWLSDTTKQNALDKLARITLKVAYPETVPNDYKGITISKTESLYDTVKDLNAAEFQTALNNFDKKVDKSIWSMPSYLVNAQYDPQSNDLTIPAAILQAPFYSTDQTDSQNYGGIGATIGHEISHAFDNSGAQFDKYGNLDNWWTPADYDKFQALTKEMAAEWNGIPYAGGTVDGDSTVGENMADNGGLNTALQAAKAEPNFNAEEFFETWAKSWKFKGTPAYEKYLLAVDVHAPQPLRASVALQNLDDFYTTYNIKEGDSMWLSPSSRVHIW